MPHRDRPLTHEWIWTAIDEVARRNQLSPSGLARLAGLDPTTFNRSKRFTVEGRPRWPSTESIAKVLEATGTSLDVFASLQRDRSLEPLADDPIEVDFAIPIVGRVRNARVDDWVPSSLRERTGSEPVNLEQVRRRRYALAVADNSLEPVYSSGNTLVVSESSPARAGDRVLVKPSGMPVIPRLLVSADEALLELQQLTGERSRVQLARCDVDWIARIVLVRQ